MANTLGKSILVSEYHTLAEEFYARSATAPVQTPDGVISDSAAAYSGSVVKGFPTTYHVSIPNQVLLGTIGDEWFNRIHIIPSSLDFGNLLSSQQVEVEVWNGHFDAKTLASIVGTDVTGVTLGEPGATPLGYAIFESKIYTVTVSMDGPPSLDGSYLFDFTTESSSLSLTGKRVIVFPFRPERNHSESLEWLTDIIKTKAGEQRMALRISPRRLFSAEYKIDEYGYSRIKAMTSGWSNRLFAIPVWIDYVRLGAVASGQTVIPFDTTSGEFGGDGDLALLFDDDLNYEAISIIGNDGSGLEIYPATTKSYTNAICMPVTLAYMEGGFSATRNRSGVVRGNTTFRTTDVPDLSASPWPQLRGADIIVDPNITVGESGDNVFIEVETLDALVGKQELIMTRDFSGLKQTLGIRCISRAEIWEMKKWIHSIGGKIKPFFIPTWSEDLTLVQDITAAATSLLVKPINYTSFYGERDIIIILNDGSYYTRKATGGGVSSGNDIIVLDTSIGVDVQMVDVYKICFLSHSRFDSDNIEFSYSGTISAEIKIPIVEIPEQP